MDKSFILEKIKSKAKVLFLLVIILIIIFIPRFNRYDPGIIKKFVGQEKSEYNYLPFDIYQYISITEYFRGDKTKKEIIEAPFIYRPFVPALASILPFKPMTAINIINFIAILISSYLTFLILTFLGFNTNKSTIASLLLIVSFPTFFYGPSGYIDASLILSLTLILFLLFKEKWIWLALVFFISVSIKETIILILPVVLIYGYFGNTKNLKFYYPILLLIIYLAVIFILRNLIVLSSDYFWLPSESYLYQNIIRPKTYISFLLSFGLPGFLSVISLFVKNIFVEKKYVVTLYTGLLSGFLLWTYSLFSAYSDGRHIWTIYPFAIPLSIILIEKLFPGSNQELKPDLPKTI